MEVIYLTMSVTVVIAGFFLFLFFYNVKKGQYDDVYTPSVRMLFEDELVNKNEQEKKNIPEVKKKILKK